MDLWRRFLTTGAAAAVAFTLVIGPSAIAVADPGGRGSNSGHTGSRDDSDSRGGDGSRGAGSSNESRGDSGRRSEQSSARSSGSTTADTEQPSSGSTSRPAAAAPGDAADSPRTVRTSRTARTAGSDVSTGGSDRRPAASDVPAGPVPPSLTSDSGRIPDPASPSTPPVTVRAEVAAAPVPQPAPLSQQSAALRIAQMDLTTLDLGSDARPGQPMTSLFGILGLLLIPLAGAALGYRQARAARATGALPRA